MIIYFVRVVQSGPTNLLEQWLELVDKRLMPWIHQGTVELGHSQQQTPILVPMWQGHVRGHCQSMNQGEPSVSTSKIRC